MYSVYRARADLRWQMTQYIHTYIGLNLAVYDYMAADTYSYTFKNVIYESVNVKSVKIRNLLKSVGIIQKIIS